MGRGFGMADVVFLLDAKAIRLNKLLTRPKIRRSLTGGGTKGKRLLFDLTDITRLGLALWLSRAGLRIGEVEAAMSQSATAAFLAPLSSLAALQAEAPKQRFFVVRKVHSTRKRPGREVGIHNGRKLLFDVIADRDGIVISVGARLTELVRRLDQKYRI
jgi:hypothetical protein